MKEEGSSRPSAVRLYSLLCLMVTLWALNFVVARFALRAFPAMLAASIRVLVAGGFLLPIWLKWGRKPDGIAWSKGDWPLMVFMAVMGVTLNQLSFLSGYDRTSTGHAAIMIGLTPLMVLAISAWAGTERLNRQRLMGMAVALAGIGILQFARPSTGEATLIGDLLILVSALTFAVYTVAGKKLTMKHGGITVSALSYLIGGAFLLPVALWQSLAFDFSRVSTAAWISLVYMGIFPSAVCYLIFYYALTYIPASRVSNVAYLQPFLAMLMGVFLLGDTVTSELVAGGSLVLTGVVLTERG